MAAGADHPALRMVEIDRDEVAALPGLFDRLRGRAERFVVLCDDLSFEEGAAAAKSLKSALEGGVSGPPENVLFVATSNRRHLMPRGHDESARPDRHRRGRRGGGLRLRPLRPVDRLPAHGPAGLSGRGRTPTPTRFGLKADDLDRRALQWSQLRGAPLRPRRLAVHPRPGRRTGQAAAAVGGIHRAQLILSSPALNLGVLGVLGGQKAEFPLCGISQIIPSWPGLSGPPMVAGPSGRVRAHGSPGQAGDDGSGATKRPPDRGSWRLIIVGVA